MNLATLRHCKPHQPHPSSTQNSLPPPQISLNYYPLPYIQSIINSLRKKSQCRFSSTKKRTALISRISKQRTPQLGNPNLNISTITATMIRHIIRTAILRPWTRGCNSLHLSRTRTMRDNVRERRSLLRQPQQPVSQSTHHTPRI